MPGCAGAEIHKRTHRHRTDKGRRQTSNLTAFDQTKPHDPANDGVFSRTSQMKPIRPVRRASNQGAEMRKQTHRARADHRCPAREGKQSRRRGHSVSGTAVIRCSRSVTKRTQIISGSAGGSANAMRRFRRSSAWLSPRHLRMNENLDLDILTVVMTTNSQLG
jgi:hypothetical protein